MRDGPLPDWMNHAIPGLVLFALLLLIGMALGGCVTVHECGVGFEQRKLQAGCEWDFSQARP